MFLTYGHSCNPKIHRHTHTHAYSHTSTTCLFISCILVALLMISRWFWVKKWVCKKLVGCQMILRYAVFHSLLGNAVSLNIYCNCVCVGVCQCLYVDPICVYTSRGVVFFRKRDINCDSWKIEYYFYFILCWLQPGKRCK